MGLTVSCKAVKVAVRRKKVAVRRKTKTKEKTFPILVMSHVESVQLSVNVRRPKF